MDIRLSVWISVGTKVGAGKVHVTPPKKQFSGDEWRAISLSAGRVLGIPVGLDFSWFLIFVLLTWSLAVSYFPH